MASDAIGRVPAHHRQHNVPDMVPDGVTILNALSGIDVNAVASEILDMPKEALYRVKSPFEVKWAVRHDQMFDLPPAVAEAMDYLEGTVFAWLNKNVPHMPLSLHVDTDRYYGGVFKYAAGGRLQAHVDAGIRPQSRTGAQARTRKHWTALMYLGKGTGDLQFWLGDKCTIADPKIYEGIGFVKCTEPKIVLFENNDHAWHGSAPNWSHEQRLVLTVSYMSDEVDAFDNKRERAFFVPYPDEEWDADMYAERDQRATALPQPLDRM